MWNPFKKKKPTYGGVMGGVINALQNTPEAFEICDHPAKDGEEPSRTYHISSDEIAISYGGYGKGPWDVQIVSQDKKKWSRQHFSSDQLKIIHAHVEEWRNNNGHLLTGVETLSSDAILSAAREFIEQCPEVALLSPNEEVRKYAQREMDKKDEK